MGGGRRAMARAEFQKDRAVGTAQLENEIFRENLVQTERYRTGALGLLGTPGTYEDSYEDVYAREGGPGVSAPTGMFNLVERTEESKLPIDLYQRGVGGVKGIYTKQEIKDAKQYEKTGGLLGKPLDKSRTDDKGRGWILDPDVALQELSKTRQFRMVSRLTAEADQLQRQEGPMWESLKQAVQNPILQGAAAANEELTKELAREAARGGSARNRAVNVSNKIQAQNNIMRDRVNAMWTTSLALKQWTQDNAVRQLAFNQSWVANLGGIRDQFTNYTQSAQQFYGSQILPSVVNAQGQNQQAAAANNNAAIQLAQMQQDRSNQMANLVTGAANLAAGAYLTSVSQPAGGGGNYGTTSNNYAVSPIMGGP